MPKKPNKPRVNRRRRAPQRRKLTKRFIDALNPEGKAQVKVYDSVTLGFGVLVSKTGRRSFFVEYVPPGGGNRRRMTIGHYGPMTLDQARSEARRVLGQVESGLDPLDQREEERAAGTFAEWADEYLARGQASKRWAPGTTVEVTRHLKRAKEAFGRKRLADLDARTIERWRDRVLENSGLTEANRELSTVKAAFAEAWRRGLIPTNEAAKVRTIGGEQPRTRTLSDYEMKALMEALDNHENPQFRVAMLWLAMTGARRSEVLRARWSDLRLDPPDRAEWTIPKAKNRRPSVRPIPPELVVELNHLPRDSTLVIGHNFTKKTFYKAWARLRDAAGLDKDIHLHDLRRTAGLLATRIGGLQVAQRLLGHANISTTARIYAPLTTDDLRGPQREAVARILPFKKKKAKGEDEE
ncbi:tyrosine-type recombinase/integrase [Myxococcota bacterium]